MNDFLSALEKQGKLRRQKVGVTQIEGMLKEAIKDLQEANLIKDLADRATYILAYMAMLKAGRSLLLLHGYTPDDGGQHKTVVDACIELLGKQFEQVTLHFERMRRKRNEMTYEAGFLTSQTESKKALADAVLLVQEILEHAKSKNPQLELKFDI